MSLKAITYLPPANSLILRTLAWGWFVAAILFHVNTVQRMAGWQLNTDFYKFRLSATSALEGRSPYLEVWTEKRLYSCDDERSCLLPSGSKGAASPITVPLGCRLCLHPNLNSPLFVAITMPLALVNEAASWKLWSMLSMACLLVSGYLIMAVWWQSGAPGSGTRWALITASLLSWTPTVINTELGQVASVLLMLMLLVVYLVRAGRPYLAGLLLGLCVGLKLFLALFFVTLAITRQKRALAGMVVGFLVALVGGWWAVGVEGYRDYIAVLQLVDWQGDSWNASWPGVIARLEVAVPDMASYLSLIEYGVALVLASVAMWYLVGGRVVCWLHEPTQTVEFRHVVSITLLLCLLLSPLAWKYYFLLLVIPCLVMAKTPARPSITNVHLWGVLGFLIIAQIPVAMFRIADTAGLGDIFYASASFIALMLLFICYLSFLSKNIQRQDQVSFSRDDAGSTFATTKD